VISAMLVLGIEMTPSWSQEGPIMAQPGTCHCREGNS
jgi:hypothetical protein